MSEQAIADQSTDCPSTSRPQITTRPPRFVHTVKTVFFAEVFLSIPSQADEPD